MNDFAALPLAAATFVSLLIIIAGALTGLIQLLELIGAAVAFRRNAAIRESNVLWRRFADAAPGVSLLAPAYNESATIGASIRSLLSVNYPNLEVVVINDGSSDDTFEVLRRSFRLEPTARQEDNLIPHGPVRGIYRSLFDPRLVVVDQENGGKADALNSGLNIACKPLVCAIDADSVLEPDALLRAVVPFIDDPERTVAVGGTIRVANGCKLYGGRVVSISTPADMLGLIQAVEYLRAFLMARVAWSGLNALTVVSGAFGLFRRDRVMEIGGYLTSTVGEDMEIIVRLHRRMRDLKLPYRIRFVAQPVCWTEAPERLGDLGRQRARWQRGALETFWNHRSMLLNRRYGAIGMLAFPYILLVDVIGPLLEVSGYILLPTLYALDLLAVDFLFAFIAATSGFGLAVSIGALALEEVELRRYPRVRDMFKLLLATLLENFGYRQLNNIWRVQGWWRFLRGGGGWGSMTRRGFSEQAAAS